MSLTLAAPAPVAPPPHGTLTRVVGHGPALAARVRARVQALADLRREDVLAPCDVTEDAEGVRVTLPVVRGMDLAQVAQSRPPLSEVEVRWLGVRVASALAAMHAAGLAHGDLSPANVVLRGDGITLVDTVGAEDAAERGTPGFRAPERVTGVSGPAQDVYALGRLLRWAVCETDEPAVRRWTAPLVVADAAARPSAHALADMWARSGHASAVAVPRDDVAVAVRSRALERTERIRAGRWWRVRRRTLRATAVAAAVGTAVWLTVAVPPLLDAATGPAAAHPASAEVETAGVAEVSVAQPARRPGAEGAAAALTATRVEALASADPDLLLSTVSGTSEVAQAAAATARLLATGDLRYEGIDVTVEDAELVHEDRDRATVRVAYVIGPHRKIDVDGTHDVAAAREAVLMELGWADGAWKVRDARAA